MDRIAISSVLLRAFRRIPRGPETSGRGEPGAFAR
jgi:hypothetical protein